MKILSTVRLPLFYLTMLCKLYYCFFRNFKTTIRLNIYRNNSKFIHTNVTFSLMFILKFPQQRSISFSGRLAICIIIPSIFAALQRRLDTHVMQLLKTIEIIKYHYNQISINHGA